MNDLTKPLLVDSSFDQAQNDGGQDDIIKWNGSGSALAAGNAVHIDPAVSTYGLGNHVEITDTADTVNFAGVAVEAIADGAQGRIRRRGVVLQADVETGVSAEDPLKVSGTTAGHLDTGTVGTDHIVGFALEAESGGKADVYLY